MEVTRISNLSGQKNTMQLDITEDQLYAYELGFGHIQDIFPQLNADEREFLISGITKQEWDSIFG